MTFIKSFSQLRKNDILTAGGKGANLGELVTAGFSVPGGFVLTTAAYQVFVGVHNLQQPIMALVTGASAGDPQARAAASEKIKQLFLAPEIPEDIVDGLLSAYGALEEGHVAVRSSATAEDLPSASFAGQQESYLNVYGREALSAAVKECWASLWTARALAYRDRLGIDHAKVAMAVVVQTMVPATVSGILFTANPATGARDELVVNASFGLGEAIVSGQVTPDDYLLDRQTRAVKQITLGSKEIMIMPAAKQRTTIQPVPEAQRSQTALIPAKLDELTVLGIQIEQHFGGDPQDIEWALADGRIWILQSRPITNLPPQPLHDVRWDPPRPGTIWMRRQIVEHMPEPLSPLFDELYLQNGLDESMNDIALFLSELSGIEIDVWDFVDPPFAATINGFAYSIASFNFSLKLIPIALRMYISVLPKMIRHLIPRWRDESLPAYRALIAEWKSLDLATAADEELLRGIRLLALEDAIYWFAASVPLGMARTMDAFLDGFVKLPAAGLAGKNGASPNSAAYLQGFPSIAVDAQAELEAIARKIEISDTLRPAVTNTPAADLPKMLSGHPEGQEILGDLQAYLDAYGHQIFNLDFAVPTLADDPLPVLLGLKTAVQHPQRDARVRQAEMAREREELAARTKRSLDPIRGWIFRILLGWAQRFSPYREEALFYVGAAWPALRRLAFELGRRLVEAGSLDDPGDVFFLRTAELAAAGAARAEGKSRPDLAVLARERRILREARKRLDPPVVVPPGGKLKFGPIDMGLFEPKARSASSGPMLDGFAVSPGQVTAPASVIRSPEDFSKMAADTILVCTTTTPAWTPLFAQAKGLVTDIGGALAHGSIVAREYGIPAVMGTGEATQRIKSGQLIRVDGDSGTVTLIDELEAEEIGTSELVEVAEKGSPVKKIALAGAALGLVVGLLVWWKKRG